MKKSGLELSRSLGYETNSEKFIRDVLTEKT